MYIFMCDFGFPNKYLLRTLILIIIVNIYCRLPIYCVSHLEGENNKEKDWGMTPRGKNHRDENIGKCFQRHS